MNFCDRLSFAYPDAAPVLRHLSLSMTPGQRIALTGPSGSGKTTLLYLLAGLYRPQTGTVDAPEVSMVFQEDRLAPGLTALGQLRLVAPRREERELRALLAELGLTGWEDAPPTKMSGGMRRRVALARAAAFDRPLWLLDEPFTGLDADSLEQAAAFVLRHLPKDGYLIAALHKEEEAALLRANPVPLDSLQV